MSTTRKFRLGALIQATGHHIAAWRHPDSQADAGLNFEHYKEITQTAERGLFDALKTYLLNRTFCRSPPYRTRKS